jgi:HEAT repeat protein
MKLVLVLAGIVAIFLGGCGQSQKPSLAGSKPVSHWLQALNDADAKVRRKAVFKLGNVGVRDSAALPALIDELKDCDPTVRCEAILALVKNGRAAKDALPTLTEMQQHDRNAQVRAYAARACEKLQGRT